MGRTEEALRQMDRVLEEDPLSQMWHWVRSCVLQALGRDDEAVTANSKAVELDPQFWLGWMRLGLLHATHGRHAEARDCAEKAAAAAPWSPYSIGLLAGTLTTEEAARAETLLAKLRGDANGAPLGLTCFHLTRGEIDSAVEWAGKAVEQRFPAIIVLLILPFEPLFRQSPGWPALLKKMNLPERVS
jgi:tetratricopeptide (TPR) repeat protein